MPSWKKPLSQINGVICQFLIIYLTIIAITNIFFGSDKIKILYYIYNVSIYYITNLPEDNKIYHRITYIFVDFKI